MMTSPSNEAPSTDPDPSYDNLIKRALRFLRGHEKASERERALAALVACTELALDDAKRRASIGAPSDDVPAQVTQVLRSPRGVDRLVVVYHDGMTIKASLHPHGKRNPKREAAVWHCMRATAIRMREQTP